MHPPSCVAPPQALSPERLRRTFDPERLGFATTAEVSDPLEHVGQDRALEAIRFGVGIRREGYNLFVLGTPGSGKHALVRRILEERAAIEPPPSDLCYVHSFDEPSRPRALRLPAGIGGRFRSDMDQLVEELRPALAAALESEEYRTRRQGIEEELKERQEHTLGELEERARAKGFALLRTPLGLVLAPKRGDEILSPEEFQKLPEAERKDREQELGTLQEELQKAVGQIPRWAQEARQRLRDLHREMTGFAVTHRIEEMRRRYAEIPEILGHLDAVLRDVIENARHFLMPEGGGGPQPEATPDEAMAEHPWPQRYRVNLLVDHGASGGAPVVYEDHPSYQNLLGRIEHVARFGALVTDFHLIRAGALHRASGGYLVLDALKVLLQPFAWDGLKRAVLSRQVRLESLGQMLSLAATVSLEPEPLPLDLKIVLVGDRRLYYLLSAVDPEFPQLFKAAADFDDEIDREDGHEMEYVRFVAGLARREGLRALDRAAVAKVIEEGSRLSADSGKLCARVQPVLDLLRETDYWAGEAGRAVASAEDVQRALEAQIRRSDRLRQRMREEILRETILVDTDGERVGQINGISVVELGGAAFGRPSRISAQARLGKGEIVDIEREVELGGPIHSKGVMILAGFLGGRYSGRHPLSLSASLVFEQSYGGVEGDSASVAELLALLSAVAALPLRQSLAVTGSVNQLGDVQAVGGINEKIEGFFDVCAARGLTGSQGVVIPAANVKHLMLRPDVVEAAREGRFGVWAIHTIDEALELLTGLPAGTPDAEGSYPQATANGRIERSLAHMAELWLANRDKGRPAS